MLARRFLWIVAGLVVLLLIGALAYRIFQMDLMKAALVPTAEFVEQEKPEPGPTYADDAMWLARPDIPNNPAAWTPERFASTVEPRGAPFVIQPDSTSKRRHSNTPLGQAHSQDRTELFDLQSRRASEATTGN